MKHKTQILISITLVIFAAAFSTVAQDRRVLASAEKTTGDRFTVNSQTPKGARVYAATRPTSALLNAIDKGLSDLFTIARRNNYKKRLNYSDYSIYIGNADRTKNAAGEYSPDIAVGAAQYAGSVYDQGGYIYAAGMVIDTGKCAFVIATHTKNFDRVSDVVRFEGEHIVLYHNDRNKFRDTLDHSQGGGHPILQ